MIFQFVAIVILLLFYIGKMIAQKKKVIQTNQIARGKKAKKLCRIELIMKLAT